MQELVDVHVRLATTNEMAVCMAFERKDEFGRHTPLDEPLLAASISSGAVLLAQQGSVFVGCASLNFLYASRIPLLSWWYVDPTYQGKGIGSLLLQAIHDHPAALDFDRMLISACRPLEISRHRAAQLEEIGSLRLGPNEIEHFFVKPIFRRGSNLALHSDFRASHEPHRTEVVYLSK